MILNWYYIFLIGIIHLGQVYTNEKKNLLPEQLVNSIVENEIARKLPAGKKVTEKKGTKRNRLAGSHMKAATDAINKLVDESIVNRVEEAEKEVSQMLLRNIEHHIQDAGKIFKGPDSGTLSSTFDRSPCRDKLDSCEKLSQAGVCKTSRDAMRENCRHTCNYCHVMLDHDMQAKLAKELESHDDGSNKVLSIKWRHGKTRKHRKHHLATEEVGMLGNDVKMHEPELEKSPSIVQPALSRDDDEQAQELERIKGEANKLLAAQRKIKQEKLAEKERHEAEKLLETEKKIKEEEQRETEIIRKHQKKKKKKKQLVHKPSSKGISSFASFRPEKKLLDEDAIPFLNEDPYPLTDFVTEYDKTSAYGRNAVLKARNAKMEETILNHNTKDQTDLKLSEDIEPEYEPGKKYTNTHINSRVEDIDYRMDDNMPNRNNEYHPTQFNTKRNTNTQTYGKLEDIDENYSPQNLILKYDNDKHESNTKHLDRSDVTETDSSKTEGRERNYEETRLDDTDIQHHLPILNEKDAILGKTRTRHNHHRRRLGNGRRQTGLRQGYRKTYTDNRKTNGYSKPKIRNDIQNMIDKAFGEVLETN